MSIWTPEYRIKIDGSTVTDITLSGLTIRSGRTDIYSQPLAGYCNLTLLIESNDAVNFEINDPITVEVKNSSNNWIFLFGGFLTDLSIEVNSAGSSLIVQNVNIVAVGALARLARTDFIGNLAADQDGDQIYELLKDVLLDTWNEVAPALSWQNYDGSTTWQNAGNSGLGETIDKMESLRLF